MKERKDEATVAVEHSVEEYQALTPADSVTLSSTFRSFTPARIGLHRTGASIATSECLAFQLAHARARDAVHAELQTASLTQALQSVPGVKSLPEPGVLLLRSAAKDRQTYLQRPDMGRKLDAASLSHLDEIDRTDEPFGLSIVIADGLSALAVERNSAALLAEFLPLLQHAAPSIRVAPICIVRQGRVAVGDEVARALSAELVIVFIGERPGLSSPDSLGVYITWLHPAVENSGTDSANGIRTQLTDADRNCISNIRSGGLSYAEAAMRILYYMMEARLIKRTGIALKDPPPGYRCLELPQADDAQARTALPVTKEANHE